MTIVLLAEAQRRFEAEDEWWRAHRDAKEIFVEELARTLEQLSSTPEMGRRYRVARGKLILRVLMKKTELLCRCEYADRVENNSAWFVLSGDEALLASATHGDGRQGLLRRRHGSAGAVRPTNVCR